MNTSKSKTFVILLLFLAVAGIGTYAWRQRDELAGLRSSNVSEKDMAAARARAFEAEKRIKELEAELALAKATPPAAVAATPGRGGRGGATAADPAAGGRGGQQQAGGPGGRGAGNQQLQAILQTPEALRLTATAAKANISVQYAGFFRTAGLAAEQADAVTSLMADRQSIQQDLLAAAQAAGMETDPQSLRALVASEQEKIDAQIRNTMGETAYAQYQTYQSTLTRRQEVASYQQQLTMAGVPLDANQAEALVAALGPSTNGGGGGGRVAIADGGALAFGGGGGGRGGGGGGGGGVTNISANNIAAASTVLSPAQLQVLQATQQAQQASTSLNQLTQAARGGPQRGGQAQGAAAPAGRTGAAAGTVAAPAATRTAPARGN